MKANMNSNRIQFGEICKVANRLRKELNCSQKEAYARAKAILENESTGSNRTQVGLTKEQFVEKLRGGSVKFSYRSTRGMVVTTKGTLKPEMITTTRKIAGAKTPKNPAGIAYYDRIHGIYRTVLFENLVEVF